jgi:hypothetical protein
MFETDYGVRVKSKAWNYVNYVLLWIDTHVIESAWQFLVSSTGFYENFIYYLGINRQEWFPHDELLFELCKEVLRSKLFTGNGTDNQK